MQNQEVRSWIDRPKQKDKESRSDREGKIVEMSKRYNRSQGPGASADVGGKREAQ